MPLLINPKLTRCLRPGDYPEELRERFEEAAGIKKYRVKKREAQRKLENTENNLLRIRDILGELSGQIEPLREQSETAIQYNTLTNRLREVEVEQLAADYKRLQDELLELTQISSKSEIEAQTQEKEIEMLEASGLVLGEKISDAEKQMDDVRLLQQMAISNLQRQESARALSAERRVSAERTLATLEGDLTGLEIEKERNLAELKAYEVSITQARAELEVVEKSPCRSRD